MVKAFSKDPNVEYAEAIPINFPDDIPDDILYDQCQHLPQILAPEAWNIFHGEDGPEVIIAIIDNGTYWKHEDLAENIWQNLGEDFDGDGKTLEFIGGEWVFDPDDENVWMMMGMVTLMILSVGILWQIIMILIIIQVRIMEHIRQALQQE